MCSRSTFSPHLFVALLAWTAGCEFFNNSDSGSPGPAAGNPRPGVFPKFALGVHYAERGLARPFGEAGLKWARARMDAFSWARIEKDPPARPGEHRYDWSCADALVAEYQAAGIANLQASISSISSWGTFSLVDLTPKAEHRDDYEAWVRAMVERYDHDGMADMPGLRAPIRFWVVGNEWSANVGFASADDYLGVLEMTHTAARAASPDVQIGTVPFLLFDIFEGDEPTEAQILMRSSDPPPPWRNSVLGMRNILAKPEAFEYINVHSVGDYTELPPMLRWLRTEMKKRGYEKPIWIDEATPIGYLVARKPNPDVDLPAIFPVTPAIQANLHTLLVDVARMEEPAYGRGLAWIQTQVATGLVKKVVTAMAAGAVGIQMASTEDVLNDNTPFVRHNQVELWGSAAMTGLIDVSRESSAVCTPRRPVAPRPAFSNLALLLAKLGPNADATITQISVEAKGPKVYRYAGGRPFLIAWNEPRVLHLPGEVEMPVNAALPFPGAARVRVSRVATAGAPPADAVRDLNVVDGTVTVQLTTVPVIIESL